MPRRLIALEEVLVAGWAGWRLHEPRRLFGRGASQVSPPLPSSGAGSFVVARPSQPTPAPQRGRAGSVRTVRKGFAGRRRALGAGAELRNGRDAHRPVIDADRSVSQATN